jgi:hypothetical protein
MPEFCCLSLLDCVESSNAALVIKREPLTDCASLVRERIAHESIHGKGGEKKGYF